MTDMMRYLTKQKLEWLIADAGLYVSAAKDQSDETEGISDQTYLSKYLAQTVKGLDPDLLTDLDKLMLGMQDVGRKKNFLSCWYLGTEENLEMWNEYGTEGVILFTDEWKLMSAFAEPLEHALEGYPVTYDDALKAGALHDPLRVKHKKFHKENEFRVVFSLSKYSILTGFESMGGHDGDNLTHESPNLIVGMSQKGRAQALKVIRRKNRGLVLDFNFGRAIREVRVHPLASDEELRNVEKHLLSIGITCPVNHSHLRRDDCSEVPTCQKTGHEAVETRPTQAHDKRPTP
ncbi:hypothetical protein [Pseudomonas monteilii]|uniref:DUF2971 domain-containing protein n=1 Tax=Pseudomonas monteilii TaxID=76759 RepID=A0A399M4U2_9PSED|nr:hypothetical protein [Pseudomonas monteilii]RII76794.1 hypothetical protein D0894_15265 [Pseudomonas monteilii]